MGKKLERFLGAIGGALNENVYMANRQQYAAEAADERLQERTAKDNNLKIVLGGLSAKSALIQKMGVDDPRVMKIVAGAKNDIMQSDLDEPTKKSLMGAYGDELAHLAGLGKDKAKGSAFSAIDEKGKPVMAIENEKGQIVDASTFEHKPLWTKAPTKTEQRTGALTSSQSGKVTLGGIEGEQNLRNNVREIGNLMDTVANPDFVGGLTGDAIQGLNSARQQVSQLFGGENYLTEDGKLNPAAFSEKGTFRAKAIAGNLAESEKMELAFILAKSLNPDGKISDADVRQAGMILGDSADPKVRHKLLSRVQQRIVDKYNSDQGVIARHRKEPYKALKLKDLTGALEQEKKLEEGSPASRIMNKVGF